MTDTELFEAIKGKSPELERKFQAALSRMTDDDAYVVKTLLGSFIEMIHGVGRGGIWQAEELYRRTRQIATKVKALERALLESDPSIERETIRTKVDDTDWWKGS